MRGAAAWALAFLVGALAARACLLGSVDLLAHPSLRRENHRGRSVPTAGGIAVVLAVLAVEAGRALAGAAGLGDEPGLTSVRSIVLFAVVAYGFLGFVDDLLGSNDDRGFRGHLAAAARGRLTTGFVKLAGGGAVAVVLVATPGFADGRRLVVDALLVALCANLANLLDRAPGRTLKVGLVVYVPLAVALAAGPVGIAVATAMGALGALLLDDLREQLMLGDTGANIVGAVLGLGVVLGTGPGTRLAVLIVVAALNVASEVVSFSAVIARVPVLRALDRFGRPG